MRNTSRAFAVCVGCLRLADDGHGGERPPGGVYRVRRVCGDCHAKEYKAFSRFAKKAHSFKSVQIMAPKLTEQELKECYACHTTGYGRPGGFKSVKETPHLADAGCEVCHGPGKAHAESGDAALIKRSLDIKDCESCHNSERVQAFNYKPLLFGGAH